MVPVPISARNSHSSRLLYLLFSLASQYVHRISPNNAGTLTDSSSPILVKRASEFKPKDPKSIVFAILIPVLVLSSGLFAGLTLGYMSLDETQLNVLSISGTPDQRKYANKIMPIRKNGHLLLVTLLLANMIVNESLPVIADPILGGGVESVVVSTVLIVIFAEIIPQSLFTRHGLYLGAKMAGFTKYLIYFMGVIAWPVAKLLEFVLGSHHGIIYRRAELKELIAMHDTRGTHGGDLKTDTVTIIGATLDLQEKVVRQAMTPIKDVFMLSIDSKLDYNLLKKICQTGHSRVPVYEEVDVPASVVANLDLTGVDGTNPPEDKEKQRTRKVKKIIGILLVKQCVLLDPKEATPLRKIPLNKVPFVPNDEPLLGILDKFQEGRSHMAIVSRFSAEKVEKAASVKKAVKHGLTHKLRKRVGMESSDSESESSGDEEKGKGFNKKRRRFIDGLKRKNSDEDTVGGGSTIKEKDEPKDDNLPMIFQGASPYDVEDIGAANKENYDAETEGEVLKEKDVAKGSEKRGEEARKKDEGRRRGFQLPKLASGMTSMSMMEQSMPADAVLAKSGATEFLQSFDPAVMPIGIITLEDVLEELIGEEIYDEFDTQGAHGDPYEVPPPNVIAHDFGATSIPATPQGSEAKSRPSSMHRFLTTVTGGGMSHDSGPTKVPQPQATVAPKGFFRTRSAPPERDSNEAVVSTGKTVRIDDRPKEAQAASSPPIHMPKPVRSIGRSPPSIILEQHSSASSSDSGVETSLLPMTSAVAAALNAPSLGADGKSKTLPATSSSISYPSSPVVQPGVTPIVTAASTPAHPVTAPVPAVQSHKQDKAPSRSTSPALPLEAILLDRKRRLAAAHGQTPGAVLLGLNSPSSSMAGGAAAAASIAPSPAPSLNTNTSYSHAKDGVVVGPGAGAGGAGTSNTLSIPSPLGAPAMNVPSISKSTAASSASGPSVKGTRFKSSPLGGFDRSGVVVAEQVNAAYSKDGGGGGVGEQEQEQIGVIIPREEM